MVSPDRATHRAQLLGLKPGFRAAVLAPAPRHVCTRGFDGSYTEVTAIDLWVGGLESLSVRFAGSAFRFSASSPFFVFCINLMILIRALRRSIGPA
jgi:hypothetical protein